MHTRIFGKFVEICLMKILCVDFRVFSPMGTKIKFRFPFL